MAAKRKKLSPRDVELLRFVIEHQPVTVREAADHFAETTGHARTTILTVMERLRRRRWLRRRSVKDVYQYSSTVTGADLEREIVGTFVDEMLEGSVAPFTAWLEQGAELTRAELDALRTTVEELERREGGGAT